MESQGQKSTRKKYILHDLMVLWFEMQNAAARSPGHATTVCFMYLNVYRCMYQTEQCMYARMVFHLPVRYGVQLM